MKTETRIRTGVEAFDRFYPLVRSFLEKDVLDLRIDGQAIRGYRSPDARSIWIRDHSDMLRGCRYFETDLTSAVQHFADTQAESGRIFDYFTTYPEKLPSERENWTKYVRVPVEADVEFRFVKAAYLAWQAGGDDAWMAGLLPKLEKALAYVMNHPWYWDAKHQLVQRPYTIDTWDFAYTAGDHDWLQFQINDKTFFGIMHGDNSGTYEAMRIMARLYGYFNRPAEATQWAEQAESLKERMNRVCWNGRFYSHFVKRTPVEIPGVDEANQLSLSNPMAINRGVADHDQAVAILQEYRDRKEKSSTFAEWFSIDPPFPDGIFGDEKLKAGAYVNGGIMPLVGGELARAAFEHGFESYGVEILRQYFALAAAEGETYLWYFPDGTPASVETSTSPEAEPTDGWGSSAMLYAFMEGLVGIEDQGRGFDRTRIAPRWPAAGVARAQVQTGYAASGKGIGYDYQQEDRSITLSLNAENTEARIHLLLPAGALAREVVLQGQAVAFENRTVGESSYADFSAQVRGQTVCVIRF